MSTNVWSAPEKAEEFEQLKKRYPLGKFAGKNTLIIKEIVRGKKE